MAFAIRVSFGNSSTPALRTRFKVSVKIDRYL
jgi:hypothetical protein